MRYAVVSDLHANLQAWNAVLTDIAAQRGDRILCLGDSVGYGPNPAEVLESVYRHIDGFCMGNHEAAICGKLDPGLFHDHARRMIDWTGSRLTGKALRFLAAQSLMIAAPGFRCVHGDFTEPAAFHYIEDAAAASACWNAAPEPLLFAGHTHVPALFVIGASGTTHHLAPQDFVMEPGKRYLVNPGSAGNPRTGEAMAVYCIYDDTHRSVIWRTVPFDLDACRTALHAAGFSETDTPFLARDPRRHLPAVREAISFSPALTPSACARGVTAVSDLTRLSRAARRWKRIAIAAGVAGILAAVAGFGATGLRPSKGPLILPSSALPPVAPASPENLLPPFPATAGGPALPGWRIRVDSPRTTALTAAPGRTGEPVVAVTVTGIPAHFRIESPPVRIDTAATARFLLRATLHRAPDFNGTVLFAVEQLSALDAPGGGRVLARETKDPPPRSPHLKFTTDAARLLPDARFIRLAIEGAYSGTATFTAPVLEPIAREPPDPP